MPNHVRNEVFIEGPREILDQVYALMGDEFDFNAIIPMPEELKDIHCGSRTIDGKKVDVWREVPASKDDIRAERSLSDLTGETCVRAVIIPGDELERIRQKTGGYLDWYSWCNAHWHTKWGAYSVEFEDFGSELNWTFDTAWSPPEPVYEALAERFPGINIRASLSGEWDCAHCNRVYYVP